MRWLVVLLVACSAKSAPPRTVPRQAPPPPPAALVPPGLRLPDDLTPVSYDVRLEIDPAQEAFAGEVTLHVRTRQPLAHFWLAASELELASASWEGGALAVAAHDDQMVALAAERPMPAGDHAITIAYTGHTRHDEEGLFRQRAGDRWYAFTQGESLLTRRFVPCLDEPRWKVPWRVTVSVPKADVALGNMPAERDEVKGARREVTFAETPAMPSYLLALAVGPFELVDLGTAGANHVPVRVAALAGERAKVGVAAQTGKVLAQVEGYVGSPLPWPKLDLVVVPHLFGAMENPGLITFDAGLFGEPQHFVQTVAHELVHQWFGNSVTPAWWDDLWLSEAFASWLGDKLTLGGAEDAQLQLALARERGLDADADLDARPLHRKVERSDDPDNAFDAIAYEKGQAVLATFEAYVGATRWRDALRTYLAAHAGGTVTTRDLLSAIPDVGAALGGYLEHAGAPVVDVTLRCERAATLELHARDHLTVPVCVRTERLPRTCVLAGDHTEVALGAACPAWVWPNDGAGYYQLAWTGAHPQVPVGKLSPVERIALGDAVAASLVRGELPIADALAELRRLADTREVYAQFGALAIARAIDPLVTDAQRPAWQAWLAPHFRSVSSTAKREAESELFEDLLALVPPADVDRRRARVLLDKGEPSPELVAMAAPDRATIEKLAKQAELVPTRRDAVIEALAAGPGEAADVVVDLVAARNLPAWPAIEGYFDRGATRTAAWTALRGKLGDVLGKLPAADRGSVVDAAATLCDGAAEVEAAFAPHLAQIPDGRHRLDHALAQIRRCAALRAKVGNLPL